MTIFSYDRVKKHWELFTTKTFDDMDSAIIYIHKVYQCEADYFDELYEEHDAVIIVDGCNSPWLTDEEVLGLDVVWSNYNHERDCNTLEW